MQQLRYTKMIYAGLVICQCLLKALCENIMQLSPRFWGRGLRGDSPNHQMPYNAGALRLLFDRIPSPIWLYCDLSQLCLLKFALSEYSGCRKVLDLHAL